MTEMNKRQDLIWRQLTNDLVDSQSLKHPKKAVEIQTLGLYAWALYCDLKMNGTEIKFSNELIADRATDNQWTNQSPDDVEFFINVAAIEGLITGISHQAKLRPNENVARGEDMSVDEIQQMLDSVNKPDTLDAS